MNQTAAAVGNTAADLTADSTGTLTAVHLGVMALFAVLVLAGILYGVHLRRQRLRAEERVEIHAREADAPTADQVTDAAPAEPARQPAPAPASSPASPPAAAEVPPPPLADEPIAAAVPPLASPSVEAASAPEASPIAAPGAPETHPAPPTGESPASGPVTQLKGLGPKVAARLAELGITSVGQIAALSDDEAQTLDDQLGTFRGRLARDRWVEQARFLAAGDRAGFEAVFGRL